MSAQNADPGMVNGLARAASGLGKLGLPGPQKPTDKEYQKFMALPDDVRQKSLQQAAQMMGQAMGGGDLGALGKQASSMEDLRQQQFASEFQDERSPANSFGSFVTPPEAPLPPQNGNIGPGAGSVGSDSIRKIITDGKERADADWPNARKSLKIQNGDAPLQGPPAEPHLNSPWLLPSDHPGHPNNVVKEFDPPGQRTSPSLDLDAIIPPQQDEPHRTSPHILPPDRPGPLHLPSLYGGEDSMPLPDQEYQFEDDNETTPYDDSHIQNIIRQGELLGPGIEGTGPPDVHGFPGGGIRG